MSKEEQKELYSCQINITRNEYSKMLKLFPSKVVPNFISRSIIVGIISGLILSIPFNIYVGTIAVVVMSIITFIILFASFEYQCNLMYEAVIKKISPKSELLFYDKYLVSKRNNTETKYLYTTFTKVVETDTNFYLFLEKGNKFINIPKRDIDLNLINYIKKSFNNIENKIGETNGLKKATALNNPKVIKIILTTLFVLSALTIFLSLLTYSYIDELFNLSPHEAMRNTWVVCIWLPIPILSFVLGIKYRNAGFKCTENIVIGSIMSVILLIWGSMSFVPRTIEIDYKEVFKYEEMIGFKFPNKGYVIPYEEVTCPSITKECSGLTVSFPNSDNEDFKNNIKNNYNWQRGYSLKDERLYDFVTEFSLYSTDTYYLIYDSTSKTYNTYPEEKGTYTIYVFEYIHYANNLYIYEYKYTVE